MRSSCVRHPENHPLVIIRQWQIKFCDNNHCAAALLSFFEYFHNVKSEIVQKNKLLNDIAVRHGDERHQDEALFQFHTKEELEERILGLYSRPTIDKAISLLEKKGVITLHRNPNPKYSFDRTIYYLFHPNVCNTWLDHHYHTDSQVENINDDIRLKEFSGANPKNFDSISKNTHDHSKEISNGHIKSFKPIENIDGTITEITYQDNNQSNHQKENELINNLINKNEFQKNENSINEQNEKKVLLDFVQNKQSPLLKNILELLKAAEFFEDEIYRSFILDDIDRLATLGATETDYYQAIEIAVKSKKPQEISLSYINVIVENSLKKKRTIYAPKVFHASLKHKSNNASHFSQKSDDLADFKTEPGMKTTFNKNDKNTRFSDPVKVNAILKNIRQMLNHPSSNKLDENKENS